MEEIINWFTMLSENNPDKQETIDYILEGISVQGLNTIHLNNSLESEITQLEEEYKRGFTKIEENEN